MSSLPYTSTGRGWLDRRDFLGRTSTGLGAIALTSMLGREGLLAAQRPTVDPTRPHAPRPSHFPAKAKNVLVIFCAGACSQLETWDYKPELIKQDGKPLKGGPPITFQGPSGNLARPQYEFRPRGECGKMVSDMVPHLGGLVDEMAFVHSLTSKTNTHGPAENFLSTGFVLDGFPSIGAWITYALGTANQDLPAFVAIPDPRGVPQASINNWGPGFLPAEFQGTAFSAKDPIRNLARPSPRAHLSPRARPCVRRGSARVVARRAAHGGPRALRSRHPPCAVNRFHHRERSLALSIVHFTEPNPLAIDRCVSPFVSFITSKTE